MAAAAGVALIATTTAVALGAPLDFAAPANFPSGEFPEDVAAGDFDDDGIKDLAVTQFDGDADMNQETGVTVFRGTGGGALQNLGTTLFDPQPDGIVVKRVDDDGDADLVIGTLTGEVLLMRGAAGATFSAPEDIDMGGESPRNVAVGDVNGDGRLDVAASAQQSNRVVVALQRKNESFKPPKSRKGGGGGIVAARLNGDDRADLVALTNSDKVRTFLGRAKGRLKPVDSVGAGPGASNLAVGDFDRDGDRDVAIANREVSSADESIVSVVSGKGGGELGSRKAFNVGFSTLRAPARRGFEGDGVTDVGMGDLDDDGRKDLAVTLAVPDKVAILRGKGSGIEFKAPEFFDTGSQPDGVIATEMNGVAGLDLVIRRGSADAIAVLEQQ